MPKAEKSSYGSLHNDVNLSCQQQQQQASRPMTLITTADNCRESRMARSDAAGRTEGCGSVRERHSNTSTTSSSMSMTGSSSLSVAADGLSSALTQLHLHQQQQQRLSPADLHWLAGAIARSSSPASRHQLLAALSRSMSLPAGSAVQADVRGQASSMQHVMPTLPTGAGGAGGAQGQQAGALPVSRYKTELCRSYEESGHCRYGDKCQFAHGRGELRSLSRHPKYKTERCRTFHTVGFCAYGSRCHFIHDNDEEPAAAPAPHLSPLSEVPQSAAFAQRYGQSPSGSCQSSPSSSVSVFDDGIEAMTSPSDSSSLHLALLNLVKQEEDACSMNLMVSRHDVISASSSASCSPQPVAWQDGYHSHWSPVCGVDVEQYAAQGMAAFPALSPISPYEHQQQQQPEAALLHSNVFTFNDPPSPHTSSDDSSSSYSPPLATYPTSYASLLRPHLT